MCDLSAYIQHYTVLFTYLIRKLYIFSALIHIFDLLGAVKDSVNTTLNNLVCHSVTAGDKFESEAEGNCRLWFNSEGLSFHVQANIMQEPPDPLEDGMSGYFVKA